MLENQSFYGKMSFGKVKGLQTLWNINHRSDYDKAVDPEEYELLIRSAGRNRLGELVADNLAGYLPINRNGVQSQVLDIAAGTGFISDSLFKKGYKVVSADLSENFLKHLRKNRPYLEDPVKLNMNERFPFKDDSFNGITTVWANRYISNLDFFLHEVHRILRPGGIFLWPVFEDESKDWKEMSSRKDQPTTPQELLNEAQKAGFSEIKILKRNTLTVMVKKLLHPKQIPTFIVAVK